MQPARYAPRLFLPRHCWCPSRLDLRTVNPTPLVVLCFPLGSQGVSTPGVRRYDAYPGSVDR
ncbi:hypothetical protein D187_004427 [Cystobacter fuscus DSM 2262]|uniref:Uncharacterized protein n=1 Tax=Cystobacter fuscus (strain ATCC 25194 / DSM 2262 / NBRC 100088 / M29) TaxID=1242864 RepID=S9QMX0_CYSF2|nr:hypothetical protein D187_004427 [Cystobacter fuscus DSM 2262]